MNQLLWYYADLEKQKCLEDIETDSLSPTDLLQHIGGRKSNKVQQSHSIQYFWSLDEGFLREKWADSDRNKPLPGLQEIRQVSLQALQTVN